MNVRELRIGNYFYDDVKHVSILTGFSPFGHSIRCDEVEGCNLLYDYYDVTKTLKEGYECESNYADLIPLTEEWLLKFGFKESLHSWSNGKIMLDKYDDCLAFHFGNECGGVLVEHVHSLQNLHHILIGEELELKEE